MSDSMGGQRNTKFLLKVLAGVAAVLVGVYILYGYRQTSGDLQQKSRHLKEVQGEYRALNRRFDMLSNELKGTVQASADLGKQLRDERNSHHQTQKEKKESERQCHTEAIRLENEKAQVVEEKQQLLEEKAGVKRERDRLSSQLDTVTQECSDARENALSNEQELQDVCNKRLEECSAGYGNLNNELSSCHSALTNANLGMSQCSSQVAGLQSSNEKYASHIETLEKELTMYQSFQQKGVPGDGAPLQGNNQQPGYKDVRRAGFDEGGIDAGNLHPPPPVMQDRQAEKNQHIDDDQKQSIYLSLREKVNRGEELTGKQEQIYQLLSRQFGNKMVDRPIGGQQQQQQQQQQNPAPQHPPVKGGIQQRPAPGGPNEQEEVMDLVDGEQQKAAGFDNVKPGGMEEGGAAGGPNEDADDGLELQEERNEEDEEDHDDPLPNPIQAANNAGPDEDEGQDSRQLGGNNGANSDDEDDVGDYGAVEEQEREKNHRENANFEEEVYNQERRKLMRREMQERGAQEKEVEEGAMEQQFQAANAAEKREMR